MRHGCHLRVGKCKSSNHHDMSGFYLNLWGGGGSRARFRIWKSGGGVRLTIAVLCAFGEILINGTKLGKSFTYTIFSY